jgi:hypothetical protein
VRRSGAREVERVDRSRDFLDEEIDLKIEANRNQVTLLFFHVR